MSKTEETFELIEVEGRRKWLCSNGRLLPVVEGGSGDPDKPDPEKPDPDKPEPPEVPQFTQAQVNDIIKKRLDGARATSQADLMKELGITDPAEAKALIKAAKDAADANASELDKAKNERDTERSRATSATAELESTKLTNAIVEQLVEHGGLKLSAAKKVRVMVAADQIDDDAIKAAIDELKTDMPQLFSSEGTGGPPGHNPGSSPPGGGGKPNDPQAQAMRTLHERHPQLKKT